MTLRVSSSRQGTALVLIATVLMAGTFVAALSGLFLFTAPGSSANNNDLQAAAPVALAQPDRNSAVASQGPNQIGCLYAISADAYPYGPEIGLCPGLDQPAATQLQAQAGGNSTIATQTSIQGPAAISCIYAVQQDDSAYGSVGNLCPGLNQSTPDQPQVQPTTQVSVFLPPHPETPIQQPSCQQIDVAINDDEYGGPYTLDCSAQVANGNAAAASSSSSEEIIS